MPDELDVVSFTTVEELWSWLGFSDLLEADGRMTPAGRRALGR